MKEPELTDVVVYPICDIGEPHLSESVMELKDTVIECDVIFPMFHRRTIIVVYSDVVSGPSVHGDIEINLVSSDRVVLLTTHIHIDEGVVDPHHDVLGNCVGYKVVQGHVVDVFSNSGVVSTF